jgi:hypothetical protein
MDILRFALEKRSSTKHAVDVWIHLSIPSRRSVLRWWGCWLDVDVG